MGQGEEKPATGAVPQKVIDDCLASPGTIQFRRLGILFEPENAAQGGADNDRPAPRKHETEEH
jgi:hypothetical protein